MSQRLGLGWTQAATMVIVAICFASCMKSGDSRVYRLDSDRGIGNMTLGPSHFSSFREQVRESASRDEIIERHIGEDTLTAYNEYDNPAAYFVYGVMMDELHAIALNSEIYYFDYRASGLEEHSISTLLDSLESNFGRYTDSLDTTIVSSSGTSMDISTRSWEGDEVELWYQWNADGAIRLEVQDKEKAEWVLDSFLGDGKNHPILDTLRFVGNIQLGMDKETALDRYNIDVRESEYSFGSTRYYVDYEEHIYPFFETRRNQGRLSSLSTASAQLYFGGGGNTLSSIVVRYTGDKYRNVLQVLGRVLGQYHYQETLRTLGGDYLRAWWFGDDLSVSIEQQRWSYEAVELRFHLQN